MLDKKPPVEISDDRSDDRSVLISGTSSAELPAGKTGSAAGGAGKKRRRRPLLLVLDLLIVVMAVSGLYLIIKPIYIHWQQDSLTSDLINAYAEGDGTIYIDPAGLAVEGEEDEFADAVETFPDTGTSGPASTGSNGSTGSSTAGSTAEAAATPTPLPNKIAVKAIGRIMIPAINVNMPIAEGATRYNLRVAIGHYSGSAGLGQPGLSSFLGHRMYTYGRHFNRMGEVKVGDLIIIEDKQNRYTYEVDLIETILPKYLLQELTAKVDGSRILLSTCTPIRVASHRLLVKGKLIKTEPLS